jgi:bifunctional non-homologous end joining protein LigD
MSLATYNKKRNFKETSEPAGSVAKTGAARTFVIQRHKASRLHYDFRLEVNGVLKSWAVPKGPSLNPTDKRLAMQVEDHPLAYGNFKGVIPEGNYGAGIVEIWDKGTYEPEEIENVSDKTIDRNIKNGMLKFSLKGKKLKGSFALVRIRGAESKNWLLIKHRDQYATADPYNSEEDTLENSPINKWFKTQEIRGGGSSGEASTGDSKSTRPRQSGTAGKTAAGKASNSTTNSIPAKPHPLQTNDDRRTSGVRKLAGSAKQVVPGAQAKSTKRIKAKKETAAKKQTEPTKQTTAKKQTEPTKQTTAKKQIPTKKKTKSKKQTSAKRQTASKSQTASQKQARSR